MYILQRIIPIKFKLLNYTAAHPRQCHEIYHSYLLKVHTRLAVPESFDEFIKLKVLLLVHWHTNMIIYIKYRKHSCISRPFLGQILCLKSRVLLIYETISFGSQWMHQVWNNESGPSVLLLIHSFLLYLRNYIQIIWILIIRT